MRNKIKSIIVVYEIEQDYFGNGKNNEINIGDFNNSTEVLKWLWDTNKETTSRRNINKAAKEGYSLLGKYELFRQNIK